MIDVVEYQQKIKELKILLGYKENEFEVEVIPNLKIDEKAWFFINGTKFPEPAKVDETGRRIANLTPSEGIDDDRIVNLLQFVPPNYEKIKNEGKFKTVLLYDGVQSWNVEEG